MVAQQGNSLLSPCLNMLNKGLNKEHAFTGFTRDIVNKGFNKEHVLTRS